MADHRASEPMPRPSRREARRLLMLSVLLVASVAGMLWQYGVLRPPPNPEIPPELLGRWITDDPRYQGRELAFAPTVVRLATGDSAGSVAHQVRDVQRRRGVGVTRYYVTYLLAQDAVMLALVLRTGPPAVLEVGGRVDVGWRRVE